MVTTKIDAVIFFKHSPEEIAELSAAMIPMAEHVNAVANSGDRAKIRNILNGGYFRLKEADRMRCLLLRATRHARAHLADYFPYLRDQIMEQATQLEVATDAYWNELRFIVDQVAPVR